MKTKLEKVNEMSLAELTRLRMMLQKGVEVVSKAIDRKSTLLAMQKRCSVLVAIMEEFDVVCVSGRHWFVKDGDLQRRLDPDEIQALHELEKKEGMLECTVRGGKGEIW